jgi:hypothetical protein
VATGVFRSVVSLIQAPLIDFAVDRWGYINDVQGLTQTLHITFLYQVLR